MEFTYNEFKLEKAEGVSTETNGEHSVDLIRRHGSVGQSKIYSIGKELDKRIFSIANLQQLTY